MNYKEFIEKINKNDDKRRDFKKESLALNIGVEIMVARKERGLTQAQLARLLKTKQPSIARIEKGDSLPSLRFLSDISDFLNKKLTVGFGAMSRSTADHMVEGTMKTITLNDYFFGESHSVTSSKEILSK